MAGFEFIGDGGGRSVWRHGNYVVKIPLNEKGIDDNYHEEFIYRKYSVNRGFIPYGRCKIIKNTSILVMECLEGNFSHGDKTLPEWTHWVDCCQIGININGKMRAYDYGN